MNAFDARALVAWMLRFSRNAYQDYDFSTREIATAADHFLAGIDPWESAAAICEGREIKISKRKRRS